MEVTLNKNGWHWKLQKFVYNNPPRFNSLCPYFWLTVFAFIVTFIIPVIPLWMILKLVFFGLGGIFNLIIDLIDKLICRPFYKHIVMNMPETDILKAWTCHTYDNLYNGHQMSESESKDFHWWKYEYSGWEVMTYKKKAKLAERFEVWKKNNPDWSTQLAEMKAKAKIEYEAKKEQSRKLYEEAIAQSMKDDRQKEEAKIRKQRMFTTIAIYTKYIAWALASALILFVGYELIIFVMWVYKSLSHVTVNWIVVKEILRILGLVSIIILGLVCIALLIKKCKISLGEVKWIRWIGNQLLSFCMFLGRVFGGFGTGVASVFSFVFLYIKSTKDDYCPAIKWKDDEEKNN